MFSCSLPAEPVQRNQLPVVAARPHIHLCENLWKLPISACRHCSSGRCRIRKGSDSPKHNYLKMTSMVLKKNRRMTSNGIHIVIFLFAVAVAFVNGHSHELEMVNISIQPAYHAIPIFAAKEFGWFEELGLKVNLVIYPSGVPQVEAAVEEKAWDIGIAGSVPNIIAGQQGISTIGISNDESYTTEIVGAPGVTEWPPTELRAGIFAGTPKSTGDLLLRKCLELAGLSFDDDHIFFAQQGEVMKKLIADADPQYACLWAPNTYTYREAQPRAKVFCSGRNVNFPIYGGLMVRNEYGQQHGDIVAKVLAAYLRGVTFVQNKKLVDKVLDVSARYHDFSGSSISEVALKEDLLSRPLFNLDAQLGHMDRNFANDYISEADSHYYELEEFLFHQGVFDQVFEPREYVTDKYMLMVSQDPELRAFSYYGTGVTGESGTTLKTTSDKLESGTIVGIVLGVVGGISLLMALYLLCSKKQNPGAIEASSESHPMTVEASCERT